MRDLLEKYKMRKIDVSEKMDLTPAAITQYVKGQRGAAYVEKIVGSKRTMEVVSELAEALAGENVSTESIMEKLCEACVIARSEGIVGGCPRSSRNE